MSEKIDPLLINCEEARARHGLPARRACLICPIGPCLRQKVPVITWQDIAEAHEENIELYRMHLRQTLIEASTKDRPVEVGQSIMIPEGHNEFRGKAVMVTRAHIGRSKRTAHQVAYGDWAWHIEGRVLNKSGGVANDGRHHTSFDVPLDWKPTPFAS